MMKINQTFTRWWCDMNHYKWPNDLPISPPPGYVDMSDHEKYLNPKVMFVWRIVCLLSTQKAKLRYWNTVRRIDDGKMTPEQFEEWWHNKGRRFI